MQANLTTEPAHRPVSDEEAAQRAARRLLRGASGWIDWDDVYDRPDWCRGAITLDGRFTIDELRALILFAGHGS
ncbi:hypothetical protein [Burkholderia plantarii]|uniref:hypothetical protein n=1 Tax=Burkholderia plantarii TaxID=41899 RepID=UPI0018DBB7AF|nr:hypothetical protein [Burkholderia plantarii]MBI0329152.1 hypothetical protein [Burkholderia plantarii]